MRRPFIVFLLLISSYCWLKDLVNFFFYISNIHSLNKAVFSSAIGLAGILLLLYILRTTIYKESPDQTIKSLFQTHRKKEWLLLLCVFMPIILLGLYRSIYPDENFDTFHFELYLQEYDLSENKINFAAGSIRTYYFPLPERVFGLSRHLLGHRLGTLFNTFLLLTLIASVYDFIKNFLSKYRPVLRQSAILIALLSLYIILADNTLFNIGSYKPDLLGVPFLLELLHLVFFGERLKKTIDHVFFFLVTSLVITFKLTYLPFAGILTLIYFIKYFKSFSAIQKIVLPLLILTIPCIYLIYNQIQTGNPIFPFFNKQFHSTLYPNENFKDERWGPKNIYEILIYPIITCLDKSRCNEFSLFSYRLLLGYFICWITVIFCLVKIRKSRSGLLLSLLYLSALALLFDYSCLITTGYYRYGIIIETLYGIVACLWLFYLQKKGAIVALLFILLFQSYDTFNTIFYQNRNLSWHDYRGLIHNKRALRGNASLLFNDDDKTTDHDAILSKTDGFISLEPFPLDGLAKILKKNVPIYDLDFRARTLDSIYQFEKRVIRGKTETQNMMVVANIESLTGGTIQALNKRGYLASALYEVNPGFMKYGEPVFLLKIKYLDTTKYTIKYTEHYIRNDNPPATRNDFNYQSPHNMISFIREAPYVFDWNSIPDKYAITLNDQTYATTDRFKNNKIFTTEKNKLKLHISGDIPYFIMIQEIEPR